ncbi:hypothetical protein [Candidatus Nitrosotenuis cloacae]|uniref:hypothetical protein n=1 Tax=Candidatus Nitrosotenuis cloacae TaxID=1603555 RepID=UPI00227DCBC5|nr:hypothetical protein [Candidatus Nitrosotenuis cloacae]
MPAYAEPLADKTGFKAGYDVVVDGRTYTIETISNFDIRKVSLEGGNLVFDISSSLQNNFGELQIPQNVTSGDAKFFVDGIEIFPKVLQNDRIRFVTLEFAGNGTHTLTVVGEAAQSEPIVESVDGPVDYILIVAPAIIIGAVAAITVVFKKLKNSTR